MLNDSQLKEYFRRILFEYHSFSSLEPSLELLRQLHEKHVFSIPFETQEPSILTSHFKHKFAPLYTETHSICTLYAP